MPSEDVSHFQESRGSVMAGIQHLCFSVSDIALHVEGTALIQHKGGIFWKAMVSL